jgi:dihydrofolate synthase / folylpolyglutamate synthase
MNIEESLQKLFSLHNYGIKLGLDNIIAFLEKLGNPQKTLKTFHIAGSNGKGSTSAFLASILQEMDYRTGLYTSPHFVRFNERIKINGIEISDEYISEFLNKWNNYIDDTQLTFFEVTTAMAFQYFNDKKIDYAVIETGLGGRLDATNVLTPRAAVITSISLEHTAILGNTVSKIAAEKAGIIKGSSKVFTGKLPSEAEEVIKDKCTETGSQLFRITDYINETPGMVELYTEEIELDEWIMPLKGDYQKINAALAGLVIAKTFDKDNANIISAGIKNVIKNTGIQGRFEYFSTGPDIIFDSAHNPESIQNFISEFNKHKSSYRKKALLFTALNDKAVSEMLELLKEHFSEIHITEIDMDRGLKIDELKQTCEFLGINPVIERNPVEFVKLFGSSDKRDCLVVLGSMYLLGEIKSALPNKSA